MIVKDSVAAFIDALIETMESAVPINLRGIGIFVFKSTPHLRVVFRPSRKMISTLRHKPTNAKEACGHSLPCPDEMSSRIESPEYTSSP